jgi:hypothetical protein
MFKCGVLSHVTFFEPASERMWSLSRSETINVGNTRETAFGVNFSTDVVPLASDSMIDLMATSSLV